MKLTASISAIFPLFFKPSRTKRPSLALLTLPEGGARGPAIAMSYNNSFSGVVLPDNLLSSVVLDAMEAGLGEGLVLEENHMIGSENEEREKRKRMDKV